MTCPAFGGALAIGRAAFRLSGGDPLTARRLEAFYRDFAVPDESPASLVVHSFPAQSVEDVPPPPRASGEAVAFTIFDGWIRGSHEPERARTVVHIANWLLTPESRRAFEHLFIPLYYSRSATEPAGPLSGILLHGSAVAIGADRAALFLAPSGGGKSTMAALAGGRPVLHEECLVVEWDARRPDQAPTIAPGPWGGLRTQHPPRRLQLAGIFLLEKAERTELASIDAIEGEARVLLQIVRTEDFRSIPDRETFQRMADASEALLERVPLRVLRFTRDESAWHVLDESWNGLRKERVR